MIDCFNKWVVVCLNSFEKGELVGVKLGIVEKFCSCKNIM